MIQLKTSAHGKVNLSLDIIGRRDDGYHNIETVFAPVGLYDTVKLTVVPRHPSDYTPLKIDISVSDKSIPADRNNIVHKVASYLLRYETKFAERVSGLMFAIDKQLPVGGGLGGSSTDGAAALWLLREAAKTLGINIHKDILLDAAALSADMTYFASLKFGWQKDPLLFGGGIGDILDPVSDFEGGEDYTRLMGLSCVIITPNFSVDTITAYSRFDDISEKYSELKNDNMSPGFNIFELLLPKEQKSEIEQIKNHLTERHAVLAMMSGSGSSVFGLFKTAVEARAAADLYAGGARFKKVTSLRIS